MFNDDSYNARLFKGEGCVWVRAVRASWAEGLGWEMGKPRGWKGLERAELEGDNGRAWRWGRVQRWGRARGAKRILWTWVRKEPLRDFEGSSAKRKEEA